MVLRRVANPVSFGIWGFKSLPRRILTKMRQKKEKIVISLGGSLIVKDRVDMAFLKKFKKFILKHTQTKQFYIITGGGKPAREYARAAAKISRISPKTRDWIGIKTTRLNAELVKAMFGKYAYQKIITNPKQKIRTNKPVILAAGYRPGSSSDLDAVIIAKTAGTKEIINLTDVDYVYDKNPRKYRNAKPLKKTDWNTFRKIIPNKWKYGMNVPFDPVASKEAQKLGLRVIVMNGKKINEVNKLFHNKKFKGTVIE